MPLTEVAPTEFDGTYVDVEPPVESSLRRSPKINELAAALAKAQGAMTGAKKDSDNPFFKSKYADLAAVVEAIRHPLSDNGLAYVQGTDSSNPELIGVVTLLMHSSGQWIESLLKMKPSKTDPQGIGSAITYARRYAIQSMMGVAAEDDDGNAASGPGKPAAAHPAPAPARTEEFDWTDPLTVQQSTTDYLADVCVSLEKAWKKPGSVIAENPPDSDRFWVINRDLLISCGHKDKSGASVPKALFATQDPSANLTREQIVTMSRAVVRALDKAANRGRPATPMHPDEV